MTVSAPFAFGALVFVQDLRAEVARDRQVDAGRDGAGAEAAAGETRGGQCGRRERRY